MPNRHLNPAALFPSRQYGFSQAVVSERPRLVFLSGQVAWDAAQRLGPAADLGTQLRRALENVETALRDAGGNRDDVVSLRIYLVGDAIRRGEDVGAALRAFFHPDRLPAATWIGVSALASPEFLVEVEAVAALPALR